ncbi:MAG: bifunctional nuclease family protein [Deltaproteobacteria bacterium]|nr:bifunctional nuclease family protein [Deltaproteobacteria bacterium]
MTGDDMVTVGEIYLKSDPGVGNMVILKEEADAERYFVMFVGDAEFAAIAKEKGLVEPKRPFTHELYLGILANLEVEFLWIGISHLRDDTYFANVNFRAAGKEYSLDSRPSDAVALALNRKIPIKVHTTLFRRELTQEEIRACEGMVKSVKF